MEIYNLMFTVAEVYTTMEAKTLAVVECWIPMLVGKVRVEWSRYRPGVAQRVGRRTALLFHDRGTRRGWRVSSTPRPHFTPGKDPVPILQEAGWAPGPVWTGGKSRPHRDSILDRPGCSLSLYRLSHPAHDVCENHELFSHKKLILQNRSFIDNASC